MAFVNDGHVKRAARLRAQACAWVAANGCEVHDKAAQFDEHGARTGDTPNMICRVEYPYGCTEGRQATARLFAAAPDMLAALEAMRKELRAHVRMDVKKHYSLMVADAAAGSAIAKATGDAP